MRKAALTAALGAVMLATCAPAPAQTRVQYTGTVALYESTKQGFITLHHRPCQQDPKLYQAMLLNQQGKYVAGCWTYRAGVVLLAFGPNTLETRPLASYSQIPSKYLHDIKAQGAK